MGCEYEYQGAFLGFTDDLNTCYIWAEAENNARRGCPTFMFSELYNKYWGCRCCNTASLNNFTDHKLWEVFPSYCKPKGFYMTSYKPHECCSSIATELNRPSSGEMAYMRRPYFQTKLYVCE